MPFQLLTAVYLDVRGPAHFHFGRDDEHAHADSQRHHHHVHEPGVITVRDGSELALEEQSPSGWSSTMFAALPAGGAALQVSKTSGRVMPLPEPPRKTCSPGRIERPPSKHLR